MSSRSSVQPNVFGGFTPEYAAKRKTTVKPGYVAVHGSARNALIHVVKGETFGAVAKTFRKFGVIPTLCSISVNEQWHMLPSKTSVTCHHCRNGMLNDA